MNENENQDHDPSPTPPHEAPAAASAPESASTPDSTPTGAVGDQGQPAAGSEAGASAGTEGGAEGGRRKKRRRGRGRGGEGGGRGGEGGGPHAGDSGHAQQHGGQPQQRGHGAHGGGAREPREAREAPHARSYVEDRLDKDAEQLARDARTVPFSRLRPLGILAQEVRRMVATGDPRDAREARRALVLLKSRVAYLAGRETGKERSALVKVREFVFRGVDHVTRNQDAPDPQQLRNFLDGIEALVGYHRFHADDRRRD